MRKLFLLLLTPLFLQLFLINFTSAGNITLSTNTQYTIQGQHNINSVDGVLFVPETNITLVEITRNPLDNAPYCVIINSTDNVVIFSSTWRNNTCFVNNLVLTAGNIYRIGTGADSNLYNDAYDPTYSPANYPGYGNFIGGCYGHNCQIHTVSSTMYSIDSITLDTYVAQPPILSSIGPQNIIENHTLRIQLQATDPNSNETLTFLTNAQTMLPPNPFLNSITGEFTWTPSFEDQGFYDVDFYVTDNQFIDHERIRIQVIDLNFATISVSGNATLGNTLYFDLNDPLNPNTPFVFGASFSNYPGINLGDGRILPLNPDWLFNAALYTPSLFGFSNSAGVLDSNGNARVTWNIPNLPFFQNMPMHFSFVTLHPQAPGLKIIDSIAPAVNVTIQ